MPGVDREAARRRRHARIRRKVFGTQDRPRLNIFRSLEHIYVQIIDDWAGHTLVSASTIDSEVKEKLDDLSKSEQARIVGEIVAERALDRGIEKVVLDRGGYKYHGRVKALAEAAREKGLKF
ncbi:MAG: 50S ribosomal protein L18 [Anaerolineae bacterium]|nr:50S ribosomal protein L18 [Anaerolineae bacterium]